MKSLAVILGAGESGVGAAVLAQQKGYAVFVSDLGIIKDVYKQKLDQKEIEWEESKHTAEKILQAQIVIKSPGIPENASVIRSIREKGVPVVSEIEFAGRYTNAIKICITGSNGKTTTTLLIGEILRRAGVNVGIAGNVGKSFALQVAENNFDVYVIELSSFQLDDMYDFKADVAVLLNITPDHLDRYQYKMQNYTDSKFKIIRNQGSSDFFVYCADDPVIIRELEKKEIRAAKLPFSLNPIVGNGAGIENGIMMININQKKINMSILDLALQGKHNMYNSMAAAISCKALDIRNDKIREVLSDFQGVEHRLERVIKVHGIEFINDSKATNINSTWYALESMNKPVVWIVGGIDKGNDYEMLEELVRSKVKAIVCLGKDNSKIVNAFDGKVDNIVETQSMKEAVKAAYYLANSDDVVLLSPACASFDLFDNYEDRGSQFKEEIRNL
ncbi:MAG: UDP-N-acetylmuramoyl-L-alanine--D-glutamate ligase [Prolixibacteraceae bacterium]|nr:UDP-N-acetylmuramoyl-L-alanine--D-glutamate ligase [Prolixibacteraceae bacterium]